MIKTILKHKIAELAIEECFKRIDDNFVFPLIFSNLPEHVKNLVTKWEPVLIANIGNPIPVRLWGHVATLFELQAEYNKTFPIKSEIAQYFVPLVRREFNIQDGLVSEFSKISYDPVPFIEKERIYYNEYFDRKNIKEHFIKYMGVENLKTEEGSNHFNSCNENDMKDEMFIQHIGECFKFRLKNPNNYRGLTTPFKINSDFSGIYVSLGF